MEFLEEVGVTKLVSKLKKRSTAQTIMNHQMLDIP
jgi:hypothetical protein